jgi:hypothetical protein
MTTMTTGYDHTAAAVRDLERFTMPTVDELARPLIATLRRLHELQDATHSLEFLAGDEPYRDGAPGPYRTMADELVAVLDETIELVAAAAAWRVGGRDPQRAVATAVRLVIDEVSQIEEVRWLRYSERANELAVQA